jgi:hypothetical protein
MPVITMKATNAAFGVLIVSAFGKPCLEGNQLSGNVNLTAPWAATTKEELVKGDQ